MYLNLYNVDLGTPSDSSCRKVSCKYEILYLENILKRSAPIYFEKVDGCPVDWYYRKSNLSISIVI